MENAPCPSSSSSASSLAAEAMETKRKRLMRKVELAKQGWTGLGTASELSRGQRVQSGSTNADGGDRGDLDDSGPYEEIDEDDEEEAVDDTVLRRPPVGELPSFIPLSRESDDEDGDDGGAEIAVTESVTKDDGVVADKGEEEFEERLI